MYLSINSFRKLQIMLYTVPKDSENFVTNNYGAGRLLSVTEVSSLIAGARAAEVVSNVYKSYLDSVLASQTYGYRSRNESCIDSKIRNGENKHITDETELMCLNNIKHSIVETRVANLWDFPP
jgi:hypothetical protein